MEASTHARQTSRPVANIAFEAEKCKQRLRPTFTHQFWQIPHGHPVLFVSYLKDPPRERCMLHAHVKWSVQHYRASLGGMGTGLAYKPKLQDWLE